MIKWIWCKCYTGDYFIHNKPCCGNCYHWAQLSSRCTAKKLVMEVYQIRGNNK